MSWWLTVSASVGVSFRVLIGYRDSRIGWNWSLTLGAGILAGALLLICALLQRSRSGSDGERQRNAAAAPKRHLPAAESIDDGVPVFGLLRHCRRHRQELC